jgi:predicted amidohydrolase YtcJ
MTTTLFRGGRIRSLIGEESGKWLLVDGDRIAASGGSDAPNADRIIALDGAVVIPGFCDAHVHLPATGLYASGLDFRGVHSSRVILEAFTERASSHNTGMMFGGNFEDPLDEPITRHELDRAVGSRPALLARADMHSCVVSTALLEELDVHGLEGVDTDEFGRPTGYLREKAAADAWRLFDSSLSRREQMDAIRAAIHLCYSKGVTSVHEMFVVEWRGWDAFDVLQASVEHAALNVISYVATPEVDRVAEMGLSRVGGDFFLDGSFGSHTAWMADGYVSDPPDGTPRSGISYRSDDELLEFFLRAQDAGLQAGVHAIGDAAVEQAIATWEKVADSRGLEAVRGLGHRIEHFECSSEAHIRRAARLRLRASIQPAFDRFWGGRDGLYARRIGWGRAAEMNRFRTMIDGGLVVGAGSDSTVTPLDPFLQMASLRTHHIAEERLDGFSALVAHTKGAHALAGTADRGTLFPGRVADLTLVSSDPAECKPDDLRNIEVLATWIGGRRVWPPELAEAE